MSMQNPLGRARGHGSAREGVHHWIAQRVSAVFLVLLCGWFVYAAIVLGGAEYHEAAAFMARPWNTAFAILLLVALLYHAMLGLQVVIEDYVHHVAAGLALQFITRGGAYLGMALGLVCILKIALGA